MNPKIPRSQSERQGPEGFDGMPEESLSARKPNACPAPFRTLSAILMRLEEADWLESQSKAGDPHTLRPDVAFTQSPVFKRRKQKQPREKWSPTIGGLKD